MSKKFKWDLYYRENLKSKYPTTKYYKEKKMAELKGANINIKELNKSISSKILSSYWQTEQW